MYFRREWISVQEDMNEGRQHEESRPNVTRTGRGEGIVRLESHSLQCGSKQ